MAQVAVLAGNLHCECGYVENWVEAKEELLEIKKKFG